jgi:Activator of Hsp90 ATPase homolog 1-like protein
VIQGATDLAVRKTITVAASQQRAFDVFTAGMSDWWLRESHHIGGAAPEAVVVESHAGGRWFERAPDGTECDWGRVVEWDPPGRVLLAWHLNADWKYDPDPAKATELEVQFIAESPTSTRVELVHRGLEVHAERAQAVHDALDGPDAWAGLLRLYGVAAEGR